VAGSKQQMAVGLATFIMRFLVVVFFAGLAGSAVVVAISFVEDFLILIGLEENAKDETAKNDFAPVKPPEVFS